MGRISRVSIFSKVIIRNDEFDEDACQAILGDYYDNFIKLCNYLKEMHKDIDSVGLTGFKPETHTVMFEVHIDDGSLMDIEM